MAGSAVEGESGGSGGSGKGAGRELMSTADEHSVWLCLHKNSEQDSDRDSRLDALVNDKKGKIGGANQ